MDSPGKRAFVTTTLESRDLEWDQGWEFIHNGIRKLTSNLDGKPPLDLEEQIMVYTTVFNLCKSRHGLYGYSPQLYQKYRETIVGYLTSTVLPSLTDIQEDEAMLRELVKQWENHKVMVRSLGSMFQYLERKFIPDNSYRLRYHSLKELGFRCFCNMVISNARHAVFSLINKEREGELIDRELLKNVIDIFVEIGMGKLDAYEVHFEARMLKEIGAYYYCKAARWIVEGTCKDYMLKAEESLRRERERASHFLHSSSDQKLVEKVQHELLVVYQRQLFENKQSGFRALLRDGEVEHLSRMYRLYHELPGGLEPLVSLFKQHVIAEGINLVQEQQAEVDANNNALERDGILVTKLSDLRDKYAAFFNDCFTNQSLFRSAMKEAFEVIYIKSTLAESSVSELVADDIKSCGSDKSDKSEKSSYDQASEEMIERKRVMSPKKKRLRRSQ